MRSLMKNKIFICTFLLSYFLFFVITIYVLEIKTSGFGEGSIDYGFPFVYYSSHCFGGNYLLASLFGNILVAAVISFFIGLISAHLGLKLSSPKFRIKWHL